MRRLTIACGLVLAAASGLMPNLVTRDGATGTHYVALAPARAAEDAPKEALPEELAERAYVALEKNCASCHGVGKRLNKSVPVDRASHTKLIEDQEQVVPGKPDESPLYTRMLDKERPMPPVKAPQKPTPEEIEAIRLWIEKGAPAPKAEPEQPQA